MREDIRVTSKEVDWFGFYREHKELNTYVGYNILRVEE